MPARCSRCRWATAGPGSRSRAWAWSTSRPRLVGCDSWVRAPEGRRRPPRWRNSCVRPARRLRSTPQGAADENAGVVPIVAPLLSSRAGSGRVAVLAGARCGFVLDGGAGLAEDVADHAAEGEDDDDDEGRDGGDEQAVLDGGRALLVLAVHEALEDVKHGWISQGVWRWRV